MTPESVREQTAMQNYCIHCGKEQYAVIVYSVSVGESPCLWCGKKSYRMTESEYMDKRSAWIQGIINEHPEK